MDEIYPDHYQALNNSGLLPEGFKAPTPSEAMQAVHEKETEKETPSTTRPKRQRNRMTHFCQGKCPAFGPPVFATIRDKQKVNNVTWFRTRMSYHRFRNLRECFSADLTHKLNKGLLSRDFQNLKCKCQHRETDGCDYENICNDKCLVYDIECKITNKHYIGSTQQPFKNRMRQHMNQTGKLIQDDTKKSTTFASHFAQVLQNFPNPPNKLILNTAKIQKAWQANPITCVPTFGAPRCHLCNHEKLAIFHLWRTNPRKMINKRKELTSKCHHKSDFHRFIQPEDPALMSTQRVEKVIKESEPTEAGPAVKQNPDVKPVLFFTAS